MVGEFGKKGFVVIGITNEDKANTEKYLEETKANMAVALVSKDDKSMQAFGFGGYPSSALIGPDGKVIWKGHPSQVNEAIIKEHIGKVRKRSATAVSVELELPKKFAAIQKKIQKGDLGFGFSDLEKALGRAKDDERGALEAAVATLTETLNGLQADVTTAEQEGRFADAEGSLELIVKHFKGHPAEKAAKEALSALKADLSRKDELEAGRRIRRAQAEAEAGKVAAALSTLKGVTEGRLAGTKEAERAKKIALELEAAL